MKRSIKAAALLATLALAASLTPVAAQDAAPMSGEITLWHSYSSGAGTELPALQEILASIQAANPDLKVNVIEVGFADIFNKWQLEVASGNALPDMMIVPNDSMGQNARDELLAPLNDVIPADAFADYNPLAVEGSTYEGTLVQVPESLKAVAMYYDPAKVPTPPATTDELLEAVKGGLKVGLFGSQNGLYHNFGWWGAFGGQLMDETGKCIADQGGVADAFQYLADLKAAGVVFESDYNNMANGFKDGTYAAIIDGPWAAGGYVEALPGVAVAPMPAGPAGPSLPFTGVDGWWINPNGQVDLATQLALALTSVDGQKIFADKAYHIPANTTIATDNPISSQFATAVANGYPRPQSAEFGAFWAPFGNVMNQVLDTGADPVEAVAAACADMNTANGIE